MIFPITIAHIQDIDNGKIELNSMFDKDIMKYSSQSDKNYIEETSHFTSQSIAPSNIELSSTKNKEFILNKLSLFEMGEQEVNFLNNDIRWIVEIKRLESKIPNYFVNSSLELELIIDEEEDTQVLNIICNTTIPFSDALNIENTFFNEVFGDLYDLSEGKLNFRVESNAV